MNPFSRANGTPHPVPGANGGSHSVFSAKGTPHTSLGRRPRFPVPADSGALKGRPISPRPATDRGGARWIAPSGLHSSADAKPRALPWAGMDRRVAAEDAAA
jgi:hypothetical protein